MQHPKGPHDVKGTIAERPIEDVPLHDVTVRSLSREFVRTIDAPGEIDPDNLGPLLAGDVHVPAEATPDIEYALASKRLTSQRAAEIPFEIRAPLSRQGGAGWRKVESLTCEAIERVGKRMRVRARIVQILWMRTKERRIAGAHWAKQRRR